MVQRALISVSDKTGVVSFAQGLVAKGIEIISTGGTKKALDTAGVPTISIESVTGFPEIMDGRVKTLHPVIHGGLLGRRDLESHRRTMQELSIMPIDFVCVNLYPFKETILKAGTTFADAIENIDIGGPSMLRSAAKNFAAVTVVVDPTDYQQVLQELAENNETTYATRKKLAAKVFRHTAAYDALIGEYLSKEVGEFEPEKLTLTYEHKQSMRYGENSHQQAAFYKTALPVPFSIAAAEQLNGKELSYNNIRDADAALRIIKDFAEPAVVAVKHMNPCGIGIGQTIEEAYDNAYAADPVSIFGGIIALNRPVDLATAEKMHQLFLEIIIAPAFAADALEILAKKKNLRLLTIDFQGDLDDTPQLDTVSVLGGLLVQEQDVIAEDPQTWKVVTKRQPTADEMKALEFAWKTIKYVKSNAIIITNNHQTLGVGAGQMNRIGSVKIAIEAAGDRLTDAVMASDAYFPMDDSVAYAAEHGIKAIIQPGGSIRDQESIDMADKHGVAMLFTGVRHFRH